MPFAIELGAELAAGFGVGFAASFRAQRKRRAEIARLRLSAASWREIARRVEVENDVLLDEIGRLRNSKAIADQLLRIATVPEQGR